MKQLIAQYELYELDQQHLSKFEAEITSSVTFLDVIEVIKRMVDVLFTHVNSLTKDLYECSHYDTKQNDANVLSAISRLETEVKVSMKVNREQTQAMKELESENRALKDELAKRQEAFQVIEAINSRR